MEAPQSYTEEGEFEEVRGVTVKWIQLILIVDQLYITVVSTVLVPFIQIFLSLVPNRF